MVVVADIKRHRQTVATGAAAKDGESGIKQFNTAIRVPRADAIGLPCPYATYGDLKSQYLTYGVQTAFFK